MRPAIGQQRLQPSPFLISQIMTIKHPDDLPDPRQEIHGTRPNPDQRVIPAAQSEDLWHREGMPVRDKTLWRLAYDSAARANEILSLDLPDCVPVLEPSGVRRGSGLVSCRGVAVGRRSRHLSLVPTLLACPRADTGIGARVPRADIRALTLCKPGATFSPVHVQVHYLLYAPRTRRR